MKAFYLILLCLFCTTISAQSEINYDQRLLNHYSVTELNDLRVSDTVKFNTIVYYYTQSYSIEIIPCSGCVVTDTTNFDISVYEHLRKKTERVIKVYEKYGIKLTLLSTDELIYKMPFQQ